MNPYKTNVEESTSQVVDLSYVVFRHLGTMDEEATTLVDGHPTRLSWYGAHVEKPSRTEVEWARRLAELLGETGISGTYNRPYPNCTRKWCDLVVALQPTLRVWIEIKGAWKLYWYKRRGLSTYRSYLFYPLKKVGKKSHTAAFDLERLATLTCRDADYVALLLIGFDSTMKEADMTDDVEEFRSLAALQSGSWCESSSQCWPDRYYAQDETARIKCWFWCRPVER